MQLVAPQILLYKMQQYVDRITISTRSKFSFFKSRSEVYTLYNMKKLLRGSDNTGNKQLQLAKQNLLCDNLQENVMRVTWPLGPVSKIH